MDFIRDARGRRSRFGKPPRRVVSLVPSLTETLVDLGSGESLAGITDFCIFPEGLTQRRVGGTKNPKVELIRALEPDLVHMNLEENLRRHADAIEEFATVFVTEPKSVADVRDLIATLGVLHDREERAAELTARLDEAERALPKRPFTFACPIWKNPWMWCGGDTYVSSLVGTAGGRNVLEQEHRYPARTPAEIAELKPDLVFLPDEPYAFTPEDAALFATRVIGPFPGHLFTWHGTRTILGLSFLRAALSVRPR
jgi:ABC-type Fe3+-hydroxamate transport system substrate-binding protein